MKRAGSRSPLLLALASVAACHAQTSAGPRGSSHAVSNEIHLTASPVEAFDGSKRAVIDALLAAHERPAEPGCTVGVYREGSVLYSGAFGMANLASGRRLTPDTPIAIASISKQFVASAILLLAQDGKLSLDDDIRKYLPEIPDYGTPITVRRLLTHTSGMRDYPGLIELSGHRKTEHVPAAQIVAVMARQRGLNFQPGEQYQYSNSGYFLAGLIVERVSGEPFAAFARRRIFEPLGMRSTWFKGDTTTALPLAVLHERSREGGFRPYLEHQWEEVGSSDTYSTIEDLARWDGNFRSGVLGGQAMVRALETRGTLADGRPINYALGLEHSTLRGHPVIGHGGNSDGSVSTLKRFPEAGLSIAVLCNRVDGPAHALAGDIAARLLPPGATPTVPALSSAVTSRPNAVPKTWLGSYHEPGNGNVAAVHTDGDGLAVEVNGGRLPLRPLGGDVYQVIGPPTDIFIRFERANGNRPRRLVPVNSDEPPMLAFEPARPRADELAAYAGFYRCPEIEATIRIQAKADRLMADIPPQTNEPLRPLERGVFKLPNLVFTFDKVADGRSPGFRLDQWRARGMRCKRLVGAGGS